MPYIIAIAVIVVAGIAFAFLQNNKDVMPVATTEEAPIVETTQATPGENAPATSGLASDSEFKNGTYTSQVTYLTPQRDEYLLDIMLTVADDVITDAEIAYSQGAEIDPNAQRFEAAYKTEIIGKELGDINLSRVGGASLTTGAFNKALIEIKADAKS